MTNNNKNKIEAYKHFWPDLNGKCKKGWCLHHKDPSWKHNDKQRYNEWNIDDLIPMKNSDHTAYHNHFTDRKGENNPMYGRSIKECMSEEEYKTWRQNIAAANKKSAEKRKKPILQFDKNGNFIREWPSMTDARNAGYKGHIIDVCHGSRKYACGYIWRFKLNEKTKTEIEPQAK